MKKNTLIETSPHQHQAPAVLPAGLPGFSPLACSAWVRLLVAAGLSLLLWLAVFWAMRP